MIANVTVYCCFITYLRWYYVLETSVGCSI